MEVRSARTGEDISKCWHVMYALRPHLVEETFVSTVQEMLTEGYQLAFIEENTKAVAAIGFRYLQYVFNGKHFYIDDLSTLPESRGKGYAGMLLEYVIELARQKGYTSVTLDSGYARNDAHRFYLNKGFVLASHHFLKKL